jgi:hypothetical protein
MVKKYQIPVIDEHNPFYCPNVSPNSYLATLHDSLSQSNISADKISLCSFAQILDQKFFDIDEKDGDRYHHQDYRSAVALSRKPVSPIPPYSPLSWETRHLPAYPPGLAPLKHEQYTVALDVAPALKRKRTSSSNTFSDFEGPTKHARSSESIHESSFDISGKAEKIFGSHFYEESPVLGVPIPLPTQANTKIGHENNFLARICALEGKFVASQCSSCCSRSNSVPVER